MTDKAPKKKAAKSTARQELAFDPIEAALRQLHDKVVSEEIPDDFMRLLDQLDDDDTGKTGRA